ncbi:hypothetical protein [Streptomyces griseocarneus]|uniref:hypothetical protein n=1 Tax=Streptomyces griseocarneus TaxID=51201 RepID=UPI00167E5A87|nr:hypothetical protein [Streptomyces griseocarneus]MBZ6477705.1 hypothetical protein [Streptomyces griseocarneus]GHG81797.1 hypothetical protein GCM10018779_64150 [Streptomyces griseocarneus]
MPTPYGTRGGMAFSADELRVLRRALDIALRPHCVPARPGPERDAEVRDCLRLTEAMTEAASEGARLRDFLLADLARYRDALPGAAPGYARRLQDALADGYGPGPEDLAALRSLCAAPSGEAEAARRRALLLRCERLAERAVRARLAARTAPAVPGARPQPAGGRLRALPGGSAPHAAEPQPRPGPKPGESPAPPNRPAATPPPAAPPSAPRPSQPGRPIPTPGEVFPPRRKPTPPTVLALPTARPA